MRRSIQLRRMSHPNLVLESVEDSLVHFREIFGGELVLDMPKAEWHAYLVEIGGIILEVFVPPAFMLHSRHGPHFLGIEYEADMAEVREAIADHGIGIVRDIDVALHTDPADCLGVDFEFYGGSFYIKNTPHLQRQLQSRAYWRDKHPLGMTGLKGYTMAVSDIDAASRFMQEFLSATPLYDEPRFELVAHAVGLRTADCTVELLAPAGPGALRSELERIGQGMRSLVFQVESIERARGYLQGRGLPLVAGTAPGAIAIPAEANLGVMFEFAE